MKLPSVFYESVDPLYENFPAAAAETASSDPLSSELSPNDTYGETEVLGYSAYRIL